MQHYGNGMNDSQMLIDNHVYFLIGMYVLDLVCRIVFVSNKLKHYTCHNWPMNILYNVVLNFVFYELDNFLGLAVCMANILHNLIGCNSSNDREFDVMAYKMAPNKLLYNFYFDECD